MFNDNNWQSARDEFENEILPKLEKIGKEIGLSAKNGNQNSKEIIKYYSMLYKSFDPMTMILLKERLDKYERNT